MSESYKPMMKLEEELVSSTLCPNRRVLVLVKSALKLKKQVIFVSDSMYNAEIFVKALKRHGVKASGRVFVSSQYKSQTKHGKLQLQIFTKMNVLINQGIFIENDQIKGIEKKSIVV